jgi:hypothetical protein
VDTITLESHLDTENVQSPADLHLAERDDLATITDGDPTAEQDRTFGCPPPVIGAMPVERSARCDWRTKVNDMFTTTDQTIGTTAAKPPRRKRFVVLALAGATAVLAGIAGVAMASPASGVTFELLSRGTFDEFKVISRQGPSMFKAEAKAPIDVAVRRHMYEAGGSTGWHAHPYPVFITVIEGQVSFYDRDDPTCTPVVVSAGEGYVDSGHGHIGRNETDQPAVDVSVIMAPVGAPFRSELAAPGPYCDF